MAQNISSKQLNFVSRLVAANQALIAAADTLAALKAEWDGDAYATGASPTGNNITDALLNGGTPPPFPYLTATILNNLIGAHVSIAATVAANRGYLEAARP